MQKEMQKDFSKNITKPFRGSNLFQELKELSKTNGYPEEWGRERETCIVHTIYNDSLHSINNTFSFVFHFDVLKESVDIFI